MKIEVPGKFGVLDDGIEDGIICPLDKREKTESDCLTCDHASACCLLALVRIVEQVRKELRCISGELESVKRVLKWGK